jgi:hypothetical protein
VQIDPVEWAAVVEADRDWAGSAGASRKKRGLPTFQADIACKSVKVHHLSTSCCIAGAGRSRQKQPRGAPMRHWLVPPIVFPLFLVLLIVGYAILRAPT